MKKSLAALPVIVVLAAIVIWWWTPAAPESHKPVKDTKEAPAPEWNSPAVLDISKNASDANSDTPTGEFPHFVKKGRHLKTLPSSLKGTRVDGHVVADAKGKLVIEGGIRRVFDYYLSTLGEENLAAVKARIALYLKQKLPQKAALQAWDLLNRYLRYRKAMGNIAGGRKGNLTDLRRAMNKRKHLRESILGQRVNQAFYGPEEAYDHYTLSRLKIERDKSLSSSEKQQRLDQLKDALPSRVKQMIKTTMAPANAAQEVKTMRRQGASQASIQAYRTRKFDAQAAKRLHSLDARRKAWKHRYKKYRTRRQAIVGAGLDPADRKRQISALRERLFSPEEQKRVQALDDIASRAADDSKTTLSHPEPSVRNDPSAQ